MRQKPEILQTATLVETGIFRVEQLDLRFSNGVETRYQRLVSPPEGAVLVVPLQADGTVLLVREYAAGVDRYELGLPKGRVEPGETPEAAAGRELREEVKLGARQLDHLTSLSLAPGYVSHTTHIILARELFDAPLEGDEPEPIEVVPWPLAKLSTLLARDDFTEARSIAALFLVREYLENDR